MRVREDKRIPIVDMFAGPGGLGEGFSAFTTPSHASPFRIAISVEKDTWAHQTLELRALFRQYMRGDVPQDYYDFLAGRITRTDLFTRNSREAERASSEALRAEIGRRQREDINDRIAEQLKGYRHCLLVGGPPCQAYSIVGRSRNKGIASYRPEKDHRQFLYREYLKGIVRFWPLVFVMENVPGLLSATLEDDVIFERILDDLRAPAKAIRSRHSNGRAHWYDVVALRPTGDDSGSGTDFIVRSEMHGIPQARHRVVLLGIRDDLGIGTVPDDGRLHPRDAVHVREALSGLPRLRSGLSRGEDSEKAWLDLFRSSATAALLAAIRRSGVADVAEAMSEALAGMAVPRANRGAEFLPGANGKAAWRADWFVDPRLQGVCNHSSREHMPSDLHRYLFAACFASRRGLSPRLRDFPRQLLPEHDSAALALKHHGYFQDRFRVQLWDRPSTTVTSHIAKDGHGFIHPDPVQCRSLTVREAARLQTFPDNYFFSGPRTEQYKQVGNAVPPLLALQIAECVWKVLSKSGVV